MFSNILKQIEAGSVLIVHASFHRCKEEGLSPEQVIGLLKNKLGKDGTLVMPTFSYCYQYRPGAVPYDKDSTPGLENGILSEIFRQTPGTLRSNNPTYSVAVSGKYADFLTSGSQDNAGLGHGSSYENALKLGAKILLLNVGNNRNSMLHYAEVASGVPYNDIPFLESWGRNAITIHGEMKLVPEYPACSEEFSKFDRIFVAQGIALELGESYLIDSQKMVHFICEEIKKKPDIMLCHDPACEPCTLRRARLKEKNLI